MPSVSGTFTPVAIEIYNFFRFLKVEGSSMRVSTVFEAIVLVSIIMNEAISACRFLKVKGSYKKISTAFGAIGAEVSFRPEASHCFVKVFMTSNFCCTFFSIF